jgi:hypothetical protein
MVKEILPKTSFSVDREGANLVYINLAQTVDFLHSCKRNSYNLK